MSHVLVVEDDADSALTLRDLIADEGCTAAVAHTLLDARRHIALQRPDLVLLDLELPDGNGLELFADPQLVADSEIVLITGHASLETSIQALRLGAADYLVKPISMPQLKGVLSRAARPTASLPAAAASLAAELEESGHFGHLWGRSPVMRSLYEQLSRVAATSVPVFVTGESGTGKELAAQTVHELSQRRKQPFLAVNCGAISPNLIESEFFGHEKGAFTGAERQHQGYFERANGGTLFLDEITEMPLELQVKLLRALEAGCYMRVGSTASQKTDVRVIAATNREPMQAVAEGKLREDLLYRLNVFPIEMPPLRARIEDVALLAEHFLAQIGEAEGRRKRFDPQALILLAAYPWPGNVRELRNVVHRAYVMAAGDVIDTRWLPHGDAAYGAKVRASSAGPNGTVNPAAHEVSNGVTHGVANGVANGVTHGVTHSATSGVANGAPNGVANGMANGAANGDASGATNGVPHGTPNGATNGATNGTANGTANGTVNGAANGAAAAGHLQLPIGVSMAEAERALIVATLEHFDRHKERTAAVLGISLKTLYNRLKEYTA